MYGSPLARVRRRVGYAMSGVLGLGLVWTQTPGMPVLRAPAASAEMKAAGSFLFAHEWAPADSLAGGDGLGPVFNERSCVACHFQGGVGGGGDSRHNVMAFEADPAEGRPEVVGGVIHSFAVSRECRESLAGLHDFFPIVPGGVRIIGGCRVETRDFDPVRVQAINATALFGAGWIDRISTKTILFESRQRSLQTVGKELAGEFNSIGPGRPRILPDGRIGKFGWKAQFATLEEFVAAACANELGLGNPLTEQAKPWTKGLSAKVASDLGKDQFQALVAFVDTLPRPTEVAPGDSQRLSRGERGKALFTQVGCAVCHVADLGGVSGIYSDFLLHRISRPQNDGGYAETPPIPLPDEHPQPDEWKTPPLWGVADSAPYFHDGGSPTLDIAILRHDGDATPVTKAYQALADEDRKAVISFLSTLRAPAMTLDARAERMIALSR